MLVPFIFSSIPDDSVLISALKAAHPSLCSRSTLPPYEKRTPSANTLWSERKDFQITPTLTLIQNGDSKEPPRGRLFQSSRLLFAVRVPVFLRSLYENGNR